MNTQDSLNTERAINEILRDRIEELKQDKKALKNEIRFEREMVEEWKNLYKKVKR